tara:strand:- start:1943 stop:2998 length:1056 start_codon:yes stop_codon:yes gene_type:complete
MAVLGTTVPTLADISASMGADGSFDSDRVNLLAQTNEMLEDMVWKEGNLPTGHKTTQITGLPTVGFRRFNEGVALSKSTGAQIEEGAAMLEGFFQVDRGLAILSQDVNQYRLDESGLFMEAMNQTLQTYTLYGNASTMPESFTGFGARYNTLSGPIGNQVIDAGGSGSDNTSIWLIGWGPHVFGMYPKGTVGGLHHEDVTVNRQAMEGMPSVMTGDVLTDANGRLFMGYRDHFSWNCGLVVRDYRAVSRVANIDISELIAGTVDAADIIKLMIRAYYKIPTVLRKNNGSKGFGRPAFYVNSTIKAMLHEQALEKNNVQLNLREVEGKEFVSFLGIPVREVDQLLNSEAAVV